MNKSESINELATALAKAQAQMTSAKKDSSNPFFKSKYADLAAVVEAVKKPLADNGLSYVQTTDTDDGTAVLVETMLMHTSGQWISGRLRMPVAKPNDPQALGSVITYARRYGLQAMTGVPADDDDGNAAAGKEQTKPETKPDPEGEMYLKGATSLAELSDIWRTLKPAQRATLGAIKDAKKAELMKREEATQP